MRLKELRKLKNESQQKLAMILKVSQTLISRYESGEREPSFAEFIKIADYFDVSIDYILDRTDNPNINR